MVKKLARFFAYLGFFVLALTYFAPKTSVYHLLEKELKTYGVVISAETTRDNGFTFDVENANVSFKGIDSAVVESINLKAFLLYNSISANGVTLSSAANSFVPLKVQNADVVYSIFNPLNVTAFAQGEFGEADVSFNLLERTLHLELQPSKVMLQKYKSTLRNLKKSQEGDYVYDKTF